MRDGQSSEIMWQVDWDETVFDEELQGTVYTQYVVKISCYLCCFSLYFL